MADDDAAEPMPAQPGPPPVYEAPREPDPEPDPDAVPRRGGGEGDGGGR